MIKGQLLNNIKIIVLFLLYFLLLILPIILPINNIQQIWNGYYTILFKEDVPYDEKLQTLGLNNYLSFNNTIVSFSEFNNISYIKIKDLNTRFEKEDPRSDPYMNQLKKYFILDNSWESIYLNTDLPLLHLFFKLNVLFPEYGKLWRIADFNILTKMAVIFLSFLFFLFIMMINRKSKVNKDKKWLFLGYLPWLMNVFTGNIYSLVHFYLLFSAFFLCWNLFKNLIKQKIAYPEWSLDKRNYREIKYRICFLIISFILIVLSFFFSFLNILINIIPVSANFCLIILYYYVKKRKQQGYEHPIFNYTPIASWDRSSGINKRYFILLVIIILITPFVFYLEKPLSDTEIPIPESIPGNNNFSWDTMNLLWKVKQDKELPDISEYIAHIVYQNAFKFGKKYESPVNYNKLSIPEYRIDEKTKEIIKTDKVVLDLNNKWLKDQLEEIKSGTVEELLLKQKNPVKVKYRNRGKSKLDLSLYKLIILGFFIIFIIFFIDYFWTPRLIYVIKNRK